MTRYILGDLRTGRPILDLPVMSGPWDDRLHVAETVKVTVDLNDEDVQSLVLRNSATPAQAYLGVVEGDTIMACGPIWTRSYSRPDRTLELGARGMASYFDHRLVLPLLAASIGVDQWTVPDPLDATKTIPNPLLSTVFNGISLGTMAKRLVQQARTFTGGNVPIVFQPDEVADATKTYLGADFKPVWEAIADLINRLDGPEVNFQPRFMADGLGVEWLMQTGTVAQPLITSPSVIEWDVTAQESPVSDFTTKEDATKVGSRAFQMGGRQMDDVLVARAYDSTLVDAGYPLMELFDASHSSVSEQPTLDSYAAADVRAGKFPTEVWSFTVEAHPVDEDGFSAGPQLGSYAVGDFADLSISPWDAVKGTGDPYLPGDKYRMRVIGISGDARGEKVKIDCAPIVRA